MNRHPLHIQNGNDASSILLAKLIIAIEDVDTDAGWLDGDDQTDVKEAVPMEQWSAILEAYKTAERGTKGLDKDRTRRLASQISTIDLKRDYDRKTQRVLVPMSTWGNILAFKDAMHGPRIDKARATEHYIRYGTFPR